MALGILSALGATLITESLRFDAMLFGVNARDPVTYGVAAAILATVSVAASLVPAVRASRIAPMRALRER